MSRLHELTKTTAHRILAVSAALGGTASVRTWLDSDEIPQTASTRWRSPRRLHATYEVAGSGPVTVVPPTGKQKLPRHVQDLQGVVSLYVGAGDPVARRGGKIGEVVSFGKTETKPSRAEQLSVVVNLAAQSGSVLTVHATKAGAERLATVLANDRQDRQPTSLVRLAELRLDPAHPLVHILRRGIAYHHAALPVDIQIEIENAVRARELDIVCATTTLTEGVNLPVRTVIIAERGYYDGNEKKYQLMLDAPALLNAAGRAGRAGRETEGWIIVAREAWAPDPRAALLSLDDDQDIQSSLNRPAAVAALDAYEVLVADTLGLVFDNVPAEVDSFLGYCWYLAEAVGAVSPDQRIDAIVAGLRQTLAWHQLAAETADRWETLARRAAAVYEGTDPLRRRRWAQTGTRLSANLVLERVAAAGVAAARVLPWEETFNPQAVLELVLAGSGLDDLLSLLPEKDRRFKRRRYGKTDVLDVNLRGLITDWVAGSDLAILANTYLADVAGVDADAFRFEQLSGFLAKVCEHHLPWTLGIVIEWIRQESGVELCPSLPAHVHYGAPVPEAVAMMAGGIRSRRLAVMVGRQANDDDVPEGNLRPWLSSIGLAEWRRRFDAGPAELTDLLHFVRNPAADLGQGLLEGASIAVPCVFQGSGPPPAGEELTIGYWTTADEPRPLVATAAGGDVRAIIEPAAHHDLSMLVDAGFALTALVDQDAEGVPFIQVTLLPD